VDVDAKGWEIQPQPVPIPSLETYRILRTPVSARFDLNAIQAKDARPGRAQIRQRF
jgi:hypothetical protein